MQIPKTGTRRSSLQKTSNTLDTEARTVEAVIATNQWVDGPFGVEKLVITEAAVDLSRASPSMPLHDDHSAFGVTGERIGVAEKIRISNGKLKAQLRFSRNAGGESAMRDIEDRIITHTSVGYRVLDARPTDKGLLITRWAPLEVSTPSVVADRAAVIQRTLTMDQHDHTDQTPLEDTDAYRAGQTAARAQTAAVMTIFDPFPAAQELRTRALSEGWDTERARSELLKFLGAQAEPSPRGPDIVGGADVMDKFVAAAGEAICTRALIIPGTEAEQRKVIAKVAGENVYYGYSLRELAREYLRLANDPVRGDAMQIVGRALTRAGMISHSTSDFANLLVDAANKALQLGYEEAPETFSVWTRPGTLPDFKVGHRPKLSTFSDLEEVPESGEITYGTFSDFKETIQLLSYAKLFSITRKAIIDDDLSAFTMAPRGMARAASRKIGDLVYAVFSTNGNMSDGNALFSAAHSNYVAGGAGAAPSVATLNAAYASMALQTDPAGQTLNITPTYILSGHTLRGTVDALLASALNPAEGSTTSFMQANVWQARLTPVYEARIDADDTAKWYLAAANNQIDTVEVAYLNGVQTPRLEREEGFTVDGVIMKVAHDVGVSPLDWRGLYHNDGN